MSAETERKLGYGATMAETLGQLMREDPMVFLAGEDVASIGGVFGNFRGLRDEFGVRRVVDTPIAESAIVALGVGAAACGLRPVVDLMFMDFIGVAMDQIYNQAAKIKYMFGGKVRLPLTITPLGGAGVSAAAQHSQSLEAWLCHVPGLKVTMPSTPYDMKGLLISAVRDDNPTFVIGNKLLLASGGSVPEEVYEIPLGVANVVRSGDDATVVATGRMVQEAAAAAEELAAEGVEIELIDPRTLQPFDIATVVESVRRTNRALIVHEAVRFGGLGAEIAAQIQEEAFDYLDAPVHRIAAPFSPVPFSPVLEQAYVPNAARIVDGVRQLLGRPAPR